MTTLGIILVLLAAVLMVIAGTSTLFNEPDLGPTKTLILVAMMFGMLIAGLTILKFFA